MENWGAIYCVAKQNIFCQQNFITTKDVELNCFKISILLAILKKIFCKNELPELNRIRKFLQLDRGEENSKFFVR